MQNSSRTKMKRSQLTKQDRDFGAITSDSCENLVRLDGPLRAAKGPAHCFFHAGLRLGTAAAQAKLPVSF
jgi:hypothetical protein